MPKWQQRHQGHCSAAGGRTGIGAFLVPLWLGAAGGRNQAGDRLSPHRLMGKRARFLGEDGGYVSSKAARC